MTPPRVFPGSACARSRRALLPFLSVFALAGQGEAQTYDPMAQARRLEERGEYWAAAASIRAYLWMHPGARYARWPLGRLLYWLGQPEEALAQYDSALVALPAEPWLHVDRAAILMDRGDLVAAEAALETALELARREGGGEGVTTEAEARLGTLAYWRGDFTRAQHLFRSVLGAEPGRDDTRRQLEEIRSTMRPWFRARFLLRDDNQPFRRMGGDFEGGTYLNPLWTVAAGGMSQSLDVSGASMATDAWLRLSGFLPSARTGVALHVGRSWQAGLPAPDAAWTGELRLDVRLNPAVKVRGRAWTDRSLWTLASADTLVMVRGLEVAADGAGGPRWAGEAVLRRERLPGGTTIGTAYGWVLAPVLTWLRGGYAYSWQDSDQTRWTLVDPGSSSPGPRDPPGRPAGPDLAGVYLPYFTPEQTSVHSAVAEVKGRIGSGTMRLNLALGLHAVEQAPTFVSQGAGPTSEVRTVFVERRFSPWRIGGLVDVSAGCCVNLLVEAERERTAFYSASRLSVGAVYRLVRAPLPKNP